MSTLIEKTREEEILEELNASIDKSIDAMSPSELREYERKAENLMKKARRRATSAASTHGKVQSSSKVHSR
jgi:hypothetical protein